MNRWAPVGVDRLRDVVQVVLQQEFIERYVEDVRGVLVAHHMVPFGAPLVLFSHRHVQVARDPAV